MSSQSRFGRRQHFKPLLPKLLAAATQNIKLAGGTGTFTLTGGAASLILQHRLAGSSGTFVLTGGVAGFKVSKRLIGGTGVFTLTGGAAAFRLRNAPGRARPFIPRIPDITDTRRLSRASEIVSAMFNSLVGQGQIIQTSVAKFHMQGGGHIKTRAPSTNDDISADCVIGCTWVDTSLGNVYICTDNTFGAAVWRGPI